MSRSASRSSLADIRSNSRWLNASATEKARGLTTLPAPVSRSSSGSPSLDGSARPWRLEGGRKAEVALTLQSLNGDQIEFNSRGNGGQQYLYQFERRAFLSLRLEH